MRPTLWLTSSICVSSSLERLSCCAVSWQTARGDHTQATCLLQEAAETVDDKNEALRTLCQHLFENGDVDDAQRALRQLVDLDPTDASAHHNLGTVLLRARHFGEAVDAFRSSLRIRPDAAETYLHLGYALNELQKNDEAEAAFRIACDLSPEDPRPQRCIVSFEGHNPGRRRLGRHLVLHERSSGVIFQIAIPVPRTWPTASRQSSRIKTDSKFESAKLSDGRYGPFQLRQPLSRFRPPNLVNRYVQT